MLSLKGLGPTVIDRLEQIGIDSLALLADTEVDAILQQVAGMIGTTCWSQQFAGDRSAIANADRGCARGDRRLDPTHRPRLTKGSGTG